IVRPKWWPTKDKIRYGLDIQGGLYLVMGVDVPSVIRESTDRLAETIASMAKEKNIALDSVQREKAADSLNIHVKLGASTKENDVLDMLNKSYGPNLAAVPSGGEVIVHYSDPYLVDLKKRTV